MHPRTLALALALIFPLGAVAADPPFRLAPSPELDEPGKKKTSEEAQQLARRAVAAMSQGDLGAAQKDFLRVLELVPDNVPTLINLGLLEYRRKNYADAERR